MAQHDYVIANGTGAAVRSDLNNGLAAIVSQNSGTTEPTTTYAYMRWADTTAGVMKMRNGANNAWITLYQLDGEWSTIAFENGSASAPSIYFKDSGTDTGIYSPGTDQVAISTGGTGRLFVDSSGRVGLGTSSPGALFHIEAAGNTVNQQIFTSDNVLNATASLTFGTTPGTRSKAAVQMVNTNTGNASGALALQTNGGSGLTTRLYINDAGSVGIGTTSVGATLSVNGDAIIGPEAGTRLVVTPTENDKIEIKCVDSTSTARALAFTVGANEAMRLDASSRLLVGTSSSTANVKLVVQGRTTTDPTGQGVVHIQRGSSGPGALVSGSGIGEIHFADSNGYIGASIFSAADGDWGAGGNDYPSRLVFSTTADGASSPTERMRITNGGIHRVTQSGSYNESTNLAGHYFQNDNNTANGFIAWNNSFASSVVQATCLRSANSAYAFYYAASGNGSTTYADTEFNLRGDGTGLCDGSWTGGGADYAEYFEWSDGNPDEDDRRGVSVVLDGEKIRPAVDGEDPIGVISGNPSVVGDAAWNKWNGKYLRDDFGTYIQEDYEVEDEDGNTVIQQRRKLNPSYDPDQEYINREERPEWDCVGLMGKLRIRKGQPTGSRWIKMRDISDSVEEWLVR